ncbi:PREDICTED: polyhomeotic-like protein 2 isoform X1 [Cyphomyrmex costatus]|uniref:polyhomeotic-like protein 2 isoform X1 n=1 Tax=Cyphomyrmex costatus TaxID=456900 RepID=UPI0008523F88|nr:PREDICTED: polyhomeotic-like protein 2 isoform X1 [Cyphomyrmex costatus]XP_018407328.1 PREDICTED: polyhomeotic-like protein 2 isoform X1 [Cyphomyrmex costatus]
MTDVKPIGITTSQAQPQQPQQAQPQQIMIATHDLQQQQQNVQQAQQQHVQQPQQPQQVQQQSQVQQQQQVQPQQQVQSQQQIQVQQQQQQQQSQQSQQQQQNSVVPAQVQVQPQVVSSMPQQGVAVSMQHQQQQGVGVSMTLSGQPGATTITTMAAHPQAVQVIQQPIQSQAYHLQQLYNTQGAPLLMPGNLALHPAGINPSSIQVITAGKPFQSAAQLTPHMLATTSTPGQGSNHPSAGATKVPGFPAGYLPVPTSAPGAGQTLVFGQLGVLGSPQPPPSIQQQQQQQSTNKQEQVQKYTACTTGTPSGGRTGGMQFAPWQFAPQVWATGLQQPTLLTAAPNQIFIRGPTQADMFIQSSQPIQAHNALAAQQQIQSVQQIAAGAKPKVVEIQQPSQQGKPATTIQRPLSILPSSLAMQAANIRAASSVSTQTVYGVQTTTVQTQGKNTTTVGKGRGKPAQSSQAQPTIQQQPVYIQQKQPTPQQQQQLQQQYQQVQSSQIQTKPIMSTNAYSTNMTLQPPPPGVVLGPDRSIMPVVSVGGVGVGIAAASQMNPMPQTAMSTMQQLPLPTLNPTIIGNQIIPAPQVQAMPIVHATQEQSTHDNSTIMITSPDRNSQAECSLILPSTTNSSPLVTDDSVKVIAKKEDVPVPTEDVTVVQLEITDVDQSKTVVKEDEIIAPKIEEKPCNNPLAGLANTVNAITNGVVVGDDTQFIPISSVIVNNNKQAPPKAMVKPQVLTHVIEGFVIQEASEPFAVSQETANILNRSNTITEKEKETHEEPPRKKLCSTYSIEDDGTSDQDSKCENCGNTLDEQNVRLKKEKRFCSSICAKSKKREARERDTAEKQWIEIETETKTIDNDVTKKNGDERSLSTTTTSSTDESLPKVNPIKWTVGEVCEFIRGLPGCADYAEDFAIQEIDGQALMLLKEDHLMSAMSIKLGPALKIVARIDSMRIESNLNTSSNSS